MADRKITMPYIRLVNSGLKVSKFIVWLHVVWYTRIDALVLPEEECLEHIKAAYGAGINTSDTANVRSSGASEIILGKAIKQFNLPHDEIVVLTRAFFPVSKTPNVSLGSVGPKSRPNGCANQHGLSRKHVFDSVKKSLERLQLDYIDILQ